MLTDGFKAWLEGDYWLHYIYAGSNMLERQSATRHHVPTAILIQLLVLDHQHVSVFFPM